MRVLSRLTVGLLVVVMVVADSVAQRDVAPHKAFDVILAEGLEAGAVVHSFVNSGSTGVQGLDTVLDDWSLVEMAPVFGRAEKPVRDPELFHMLKMDRFLTIGWERNSQPRPAQVVDQALDALDGLACVEHISENRAVSHFGEVDDPDFTNQYYHENIFTTQAWDYSTGSTGVLVAVVDYGVNYSCTDLDFSLCTNGYDYVDSDWTPEDTSSSSSHGTMIQGIISATGSNATLGAGIAWNCRFMPIRVYDTGGTAYPDDCADAIRLAADEGADVINCSWGGPYDYTNIHAAVQYARSVGGGGGYGSVVVAAMGNDNWLVTNNPAGFYETLAVGGTFCYPSSSSYYSYNNLRYDLTSYGLGGSTYGDHIDVVAPAAPVFSTYHTNSTYGYGTSYSTPMVSAFAALLRCVHPDWYPMEIEPWITWSAQDQVGAASEDVAGWDRYFGWGLIDLGYGMEEAVVGTNCPYLSLTNLIGGVTGITTYACCSSTDTLKPFYWLRDVKLKKTPKGKKLIRDYYKTAPGIAHVLKQDFRLTFEFLRHTCVSADVILQLMDNPEGTVQIPAWLLQDTLNMADKIFPRLVPEDRVVVHPWIAQGRTDPIGLLGQLGIAARITGEQ